MNRDQSIALFECCEKARREALKAGKSEGEAHVAAKTIWNGWAAGHLESRKALQSAELFKLETAEYGNSDWVAPETIGHNHETVDWLDGARVDFSGCTFTEKANFEGFVFPGQCIFGESKIYNRNRETKPAVVFSKGASFAYAEFHLDAVFDWARFDRAAGFNAAKFHHIARFDQCVFFGTAWFHHTAFKGDVWMGQVKFHGYTDFFGAAFSKRASFYGVRSEGAFILNSVRFEAVPDFAQAIFQGTLRLDHAQFRRTLFIGPALNDRRSIDHHAPAKFRELKRYAIQGEDHRSELEFHAQEIRTSRFVTDWPWHPRFWFGGLYEIFSDFGRSILRPAFALAVTAAIFAAYFLSVSANEGARKPDYRALFTLQPQPCMRPYAIAPENLRTGQAQIAASTDATTEAWSLALKNAFVFINWDRADAARRNFGCLYGLTTDGRLTFPYVPSSVSFASLIQIILSSILLFLLLLGVRNMLKLK